MKYLVVILFIAVVTACAIATGTGSIATVGMSSELKREVAASAPVIEEILLKKDYVLP